MNSCFEKPQLKAPNWNFFETFLGALGRDISDILNTQKFIIAISIKEINWKVILHFIHPFTLFSTIS